MAMSEPKLPNCYRCGEQPCECKDGWKVADMQRAVLHFCFKRSVRIVAPNIHLLMNCEQDMLEVTTAGYAVEYEIKTTRADYEADFCKTVGYSFRSNVKRKHDVLAGRADAGCWTLPRRFWFVVPAPFASSVKVPAHAGLLAATPTKQLWIGGPNLTLTRLKEAPTIRGAKKLSDVLKRRLIQSLAFRYWDLWKDQWDAGLSRSDVVTLPNCQRCDGYVAGE